MSKRAYRDVDPGAEVWLHARRVCQHGRILERETDPVLVLNAHPGAIALVDLEPELRDRIRDVDLRFEPIPERATALVWLRHECEQE